MRTPFRGRARLFRVSTMLSLAVVVGAPSGRAQAMRLDPTFAPTIVSARTAPGRLVCQSDGRILAFGASTLNGAAVPRLVRLLANGVRDASFTGYTPPAEYGELSDLQVLADGRIILCFAVVNDPAEPTGVRSTVVRLLANGDVDPSFLCIVAGRQIVWARPTPDNRLVFASYDRGSLAELDATGAIDVSFAPELEPGFGVLDLLVQPDGKIVVYGTPTRSSTDASVLLRLLPSGRVDPTFARTPVAVGRAALGLQSDGKILVLGDTLRRYAPDGTFDRTLYVPLSSYARLLVAADGRIVLSHPHGGAGNSIVLQPDGTLDFWFAGPFAQGVTYAIEAALADGRFLAVLDDATSPYGLAWTTHAVVCLRADGAVDPGFTAQLGYPGTVYSALPEADGSILIAGVFDHVNGQPRAGLARLRPDGALDATFVPPGRPEVFQCEAIVPLPDGYLVREVVGWQGSGLLQEARYTRFTRAGSVMPWQMDVLLAARNELPGVEASGSIVVPQAEYVPGQNTNRWVLRRYTPGSTSPTIVTTLMYGWTPYGDSGAFMEVIPLEDGTLRLRGNFTSVNGVARYGLARITAAGVLVDPTLPDSAPRFDDPSHEFISVTTYDHGQQEMKLARLREDGSVDPTFAPDRDYSLLRYRPFATGRDAAGRLLFKGANALFRLSASGAFDPNVWLSYAPGVAAMARDGTIYVSQLRRELARYVPTEEAAITHQPASVATIVGRKVQFDVGVGLSGPVFYQWYHDGVPVAGATNATLTLPEATAALAGQYQAVAYVDRHVFESDIVTLTTSASAGRLTNFSARSWCGAGEARPIAGFTLGGANDTPVLLRAIGPGLAVFGVPETLGDPTLAVLTPWKVLVAENDDWGGTEALRRVFARLGAFGLEAGSKDAALYRAFTPGAYTMHIAGAPSGNALVEIYIDAADARVQNFSLRTALGSADKVPILGFTVSGSGPRKLLLRAVGPTLARFGVADPAAHPRLELFCGFPQAHRVRAVDSVDPVANDVAGRVGAFTLPIGGEDAAMVVTLEPGGYTAQVTGPGAGIVLVELYDVPL